MSLYPPFFSAGLKDDGGDMYKVCHNCDGGIGFAAEDEVDAKTYRLIQFAFNAGKRARSKEFAALLKDGGLKE